MSAPRSAKYVGDQSLLVGDGEVVTPRAGEVRLDVAYTGICGTDLHILHGAMDHRVRRPAVIGHEMSGRIAELGPGVHEWAIGDRITVMPLEWCGNCPACQRGHSHICQRLTFVGIDAPGSMQSSWTVPAGLLVRLPDGLALEHATLAEPTAVAVHDVRRATLVAGEKVVVVGAGPVGMLVGLVSRTVGADVVLLEVSAERRKVAAQIGLTVLDPAQIDPGAYVDEWTDNAGADVAFEVSGSAAGVDVATQVLGVRGRLVMVGIHSAPREIDLFRLFWRELTILGARVYQRPDFEQAMQLLRDGEIPADALISRVVPLDHVAEAFEALTQGSVVKVLVDCRADPTS
jgi:2-desacetyl-2-hydroxyethyl bacteriochlorophyllide A dehydrogenase